MSRYSIRDLEQLSGIKAHTIRIWEKRYGVLTPQRTDTNIRYYDDMQLKHLLNVSLMLGFGYKISKVSQYSREELNQQIQKHFSNQHALDDQAIENKINGLIVAMIDLDEDKFLNIYNTSIRKRGFEKTMIQVIYPFLERVGVMWGINEINPAEEHFISHLIRQKVIVAIDELPVPDQQNGQKFLLYLPENELHELGLLLANYLIRLAGYPTVYLGQNVPFDDMVKVARASGVDHLLTFIVTSMQKKDIGGYVDRFSEAFPKQTLYISGMAPLFEHLSFPSNMVYLKRISDLKETLS